MIDVTARRRLALLLRRFIAGHIDSDDFDNERPDDSEDPGVREISWAAWASLYSDHWPTRYSGGHKMHPETRGHVVRWILFLNSEIPYQWPPPPSQWRRILSFFARPFYDPVAEWKAQGNFDLWPFLRQTDYELSLKAPRFLSGNRGRGG